MNRRERQVATLAIASILSLLLAGAPPDCWAGMLRPNRASGTEGISENSITQTKHDCEVSVSLDRRDPYFIATIRIFNLTNHDIHGLAFAPDFSALFDREMFRAKRTSLATMSRPELIQVKIKEIATNDRALANAMSADYGQRYRIQTHYHGFYGNGYAFGSAESTVEPEGGGIFGLLGKVASLFLHNSNVSALRDEIKDIDLHYLEYEGQKLPPQSSVEGKIYFLNYANVPLEQPFLMVLKVNNELFLFQFADHDMPAESLQQFSSPSGMVPVTVPSSDPGTGAVPQPNASPTESKPLMKLFGAQPTKTEPFGLGGVRTFDITYEGAGTFSASLETTDGQAKIELAQSIGKFKGTKTIDVPDNQYILDVQADDAWKIDIR